MRILKNTELSADVFLRPGWLQEGQKGTCGTPGSSQAPKLLLEEKLPSGFCSHKSCQEPSPSTSSAISHSSLLTSHWKVKGLGSALGGDGKATVSPPQGCHSHCPSCAGSGQAPCLTSLPAAAVAKARNFLLLKLNWFSKNKLSSTFTPSE